MQLLPPKVSTDTYSPVEEEELALHLPHVHRGVQCGEMTKRLGAEHGTAFCCPLGHWNVDPEKVLLDQFNLRVIQS